MFNMAWSNASHFGPKVGQGQQHSCPRPILFEKENCVKGLIAEEIVAGEVRPLLFFKSAFSQYSSRTSLARGQNVVSRLI